MGMFRRSRRSNTPLRHRQQEITRQEAELREKLDKLERMVTKGRTVPNKSAAQTRKYDVKGNNPEKRFHVSLAMEGGHAIDADRSDAKASFAAQSATGRPRNFSIPFDGAGSRCDVAYQPSAFLSDNHGQELRP